MSVLVDLDGAHKAVAGGAARLEAEVAEASDAKLGGAPPALLEAARAAAEAEARAVLARRVEEARAVLLAHADAEQERLVEAAFQGGSPRGRVEAALVLLREHHDVVAKAIARAKLELDAVAIVVP